MTNKKQILIACIGLPGVGKSFISKKIAEKINAIFTEEDKIAYKLMPTLLGREKYEWHVKFQRPFPSEIRKKLYEMLFNEVKKYIKSGKGVVLEGTFYSKIFRDALCNLVISCKVKSYIVEIICPENIVKERITKRFEKEGGYARFGIYKNMKKIWEPIGEEHITIDSNKNVDEQIDKFLKQI